MRIEFKSSALFALLFFAACGPATQYTMIQPGGTIKQRGGVADWPSLAKWDKTDVKSKDAAVIIAIEDYAFLPDVVGAVQNANDWEKYFRDAKGMDDVFVLTDKNAPIEEINRFTDQAVAATADGGTIWFIFIGHGAANNDGTDGLLVGMDAQQTVASIGSRSLAKKDLVSMLTKDGRKAIVVLDTCFSGKSSNGELLATGTQPVIPIIKPIQATSGVTILSAAQADEVAGQLTNEARPAFSYLLLGALRGWADDGDGTITTDEAIQFTKSQLRLVKGRQQTPNLEGQPDVVLSTGMVEKDPGITDLIQGKGVIVEVANPDQTAMINTNEGIIIPVIPNWVVPESTSFGLIYSSNYMLGASQITITKRNVSQQNAAMAMQAKPNTGLGEFVSSEPVTTKFGDYTGLFHTLNRIPADDVVTGEKEKDETASVFRTYQNGAVWEFSLTTVGQYDKQRFDDFNTLISKARFQ